MTTVTEVKKQPGCVRIIFSDGTDLNVPYPLFAVRRLRAGMPASRAEYLAFIEAQAYPYALDRAVGLLSMRDATEKEIADRLRRSGYPDSAVDRAINVLKDNHFVDDGRFAERFVELKGSRFGGRRLYGQLRQKGVSDETAREALARLTDEDEDAAALRQAEKLLARRDAGDPEVRRKVVMQLVRRGYGWDTARDAVARAAGQEDGEEYT